MNKIIHFELNSRMCKLFGRYKIDYWKNPNVEIPKEILIYLKRGIVKRKDKFAKGCWTYKYNRQFALTYSIDDTIGNEASNSEIFISAQNDDLSVSRTIKIALTYIYALSELMKQFRNEFSIILSYEYITCGTEPTHGFDIRFHQIRGDSSYLKQNLETYNKYNGILVLNVLNNSISEAQNTYSPYISDNKNIVSKYYGMSNKFSQVGKLLYRFQNLGVMRNAKDRFTCIGKASSVANNAWLNVLYEPVTSEDIEQIEQKLVKKVPVEYKLFLTTFSNGLNILCDTLCLYGITNLSRADSERKPYDIMVPNTIEKPENATNEMFFIGWYDWDNSQLYIDELGNICYCSSQDATPLKKWSSLKRMLLCEIKRIYSLIDKSGAILSYTIRTTPNT